MSKFYWEEAYFITNLPDVSEKCSYHLMSICPITCDRIRWYCHDGERYIDVMNRPWPGAVVRFFFWWSPEDYRRSDRVDSCFFSNYFYRRNYLWSYTDADRIMNVWGSKYREGEKCHHGRNYMIHHLSTRMDHRLWGCDSDLSVEQRVDNSSLLLYDKPWNLRTILKSSMTQ